MNKFKLVGYCPVKTHKKNQLSNFDIIITDSGNLYGRCHHTSCFEEIEALNIKLNNVFKQKKEELIKKRNEILEKEKLKQRQAVLEAIEQKECIDKSCAGSVEFKTIKEAFHKNTGTKLICAPTGSGKTYNSATWFLEKLKSGEFIIYVASNKTSMQEFIDLVEEISGKKLSELYIKDLRRESNIDFNEDEEEAIYIRDESKKIGTSILGIITHHTYLTRKGISNLYYSLLDVIKKVRPIVIIDEVDACIQAQTCIIPLDARHQKLIPRGMTYAVYYRRQKCTGGKNRPSCRNCYKLCSAEYECNRDGIPVLEHKNKVKEFTFVDVELDLPVLQKMEPNVFIPELKLTLRQLQQHEGYLKAKEYKTHLEDDEKYCLKTVIADMVDCAYNPVIYEYTPCLNGNPISPEEILKLEETEAYRVSYPYCLCQVEFLNLKDESVFNFLHKYCKEINLLSATISESDREYLQDCFDGKMEEIIITGSSQKIDELLIVGYGRYMKYIDRKNNRVNIEGFMAHGKVLIFEPTRGEAEKLFRSFPQNFPVAKFNRDDITVNEKFSENWNVLISHSRGNIGRAVNLPEFYTCFIDSVIYKPSYAYNLKQFTIEEIRERQEDDRQTTVIQNAGRILRGKGRKVICILDIIAEELEKVKSKFSAMVKTEVKTLYIEEDQDKLINAIDYYYSTGEILEIKEFKTVDKAIEGNMSSLSKKQRATLSEEDRMKYEVSKEEKRRDKREETFQEKVEEALSLARDGKNWSSIYRKLHLNRLSKEECAYIKSKISKESEVD